MDITEVSILHHLGIVFILLWILSYFNWCHPFVYFMSFIYLFLVNERYSLRLRKKLQFEERKQANQRRLLSDSETVRWLNHAVEKIWPICMEEIASQKFLLPIIPWFLDKYKPWTAKKAVVQNLYLGRNPPMFTEIRVTGQSVDDDHLVLELGMNFLSADDMSAVLAVQLRKRLGFGMWAKMHITGMHVEGKVLVGVKFLRQWPFLGRLRVCFVEPPYFQMTVKPIFNHGVDVTELPGIAGWLDKILAVAFEQTLVEPNMLVVDVEKFATMPSATWFSMDEKRPIAFAKVEILEAADMKPSDLNGLADPYVKGQLGPYRFRTKTKKKTLAPRWQEEFKIPICTWESPNVLRLEVRDKDHFLDDTLGDSSVNIGEMRGGLRHDKWLTLQNIKMGRLHVAITVVDVDEKEGEHLSDPELTGKRENTSPEASEALQKEESDHGIYLEQVPPKKADQFEPINIAGQQRTGVWVHHPGNEMPTSWEPRKGRTRQPETELYREGNDSIDSPTSVGLNLEDSSTDEENLERKKHPLSSIRTSLRKLSSVFHRSPKSGNSSDIGSTLPTPHANIRAVGEKGTSVRVVKDDIPKTVKDPNMDAGEAHSPGKSHQMKGMAKSILKQAGKSAHDLKHALNRKSSQKSKGVSLPEMSEKEKYQDSESTDESIPSSKDTPRSEGDLVVSAGPFDSHKESSEAEETDRVRQMDYGRSMVESQLRNELFKIAQSANDSTNMAVPEESLDRRVSFRGLDNLSAPNDEQAEVEGSPLPHVGEEKLEGEK